MLRPLQQYELNMLDVLAQKAQLGQANQFELSMLKDYTERYLASNSKVQQRIQPQYSQPMYPHRPDMGNNPCTYKYTTKEDHSEDNIKVNKKDTLILNKEEVYSEDDVEADTDKVNVIIMTIKENFKMDEIKMSLTESVFEKLGFGFIEVLIRDSILLYAYNKRDEMDDTLYKVIGNKKNNELLISNDGITIKINRRHFGPVFEFDKTGKVRYRNIDTLKEVFVVLEELDLYHKTYFDNTYDVNDVEKKTIISSGILPWTFCQAVYR